MFENTVAWKSKAQRVKSDSSAVAEYLAQYNAVKMSFRICNFLQELLILQLNIRYLNGISTLDTHSTRHLEITYLILKDYFLKGMFHIVKIQAKDQISNLLTKAVAPKMLFNLIGSFFKCN
jgi:hypothetical protein